MTKQETFTIADMKQQRKEMAHRKRRIIFNNDGDDVGGYGTVDTDQTNERVAMASTPEGLLKLRTTALLGSQVDAIWYYTTHGMKIRHSNGPYGRFYGPSDPKDVAVRNLETLASQYGKDALEIMIEACKKHGIEIFYSNRMNDTHDSFRPKLIRFIKVEHPEYTLLPKEEGKKFGWSKYPDVRTLWAALNFEYVQVRQMTIDALREVCHNYDIDGIELDFIRHPLYFPPTMQHMAVEQKHLDLMNDMVRKIRKMTEEEGIKRGRAILVAARCADDLTLSRSIGLDVETWLAEDLIDVLVIGTWIDFATPMKELIDLSHCHKVPAYVCINCTYKAEHDWSVWRGDAMHRFAEGADGVYMFNMFDPTMKAWWELGDPQSIMKSTRTYLWDYLPSQRVSSDVLAKVRLTRFRWPVTVTEKGCEAMPLYVGEDLPAGDTGGKQYELTLRIHVKELGEDNKLTITVNGQALPEPTVTQADEDEQSSVLLKFKVKNTLFKVGKNIVKAVLASAPITTVQIDDMRLDVKFW